MTVRGIVQGVGFRPHVHALATRLDVRGFVVNRTGSVRIEAEAEPEVLDRFVADLVGRAPPLARIEAVSTQGRLPLGDEAFLILPSEVEPGAPVSISPDVATCDACVRELFDPGDRRYRYPFVNCAHCGPRLTIVCGAPYDRERTTMASFVMCRACRAEYDDPTDRRFHAQPIACPDCGPRLRLVDSKTLAPRAGDALALAIDALRAGEIAAVKGLGGYHLACDARSDRACAELRARKRRDEKPFALLVADVETAETLCTVSPRERAVLLSRERPIVLLTRRPDAPVSSAVAPGAPHLGVMLPYTPLHHLLARDAGFPLVMTSGNVSDEPIAFEDDDAAARLAPLSDCMLVHDRPIHTRCDDSVSRVSAGDVRPLRRSRGCAPAPVRLEFEQAVPTLAMGGQLKATFALGEGRRALVSHHLGDLDHAAAFKSYGEAIARYEALFDIRAERIVHDAHPDYASTRLAASLAAARAIPCVAVQHHRAHVAAVAAEHGIEGSLIGVAFDGAGWGDDGRIWGGEFFVGDRGRLVRAGHFDYVPLPGGARAMREPWRMALAFLRVADDREGEARLLARVDPYAARVVSRLVDHATLTPQTSSVGRLFDAVAAMCGLRDRVSYEGQAAMELEAAATLAAPDGEYPFDVVEPSGDPASPDGAPIRVDVRPLVRAIASDLCSRVSVPRVARRFHSTLVSIVSDLCTRLRNGGGPSVVVLSGGVFTNDILSSECARRLADQGFRVHLPRLMPANDGGICLGQLALAASASRESA